MIKEKDKPAKGRDEETEYIEGAEPQDHSSTHLHLDEREREEVEDRSPARPQIVYATIQKEGEEELGRPYQALAWSGLAAGLSMGFSLVVEGLLQSALPDAPWRPLVSKLGYCVGFLIVILGRQQLFTENTLTPILPLLSRRTKDVLLDVLRLWAVVLATNLLGALIFAFVVGHTDVFSPDVQKTFGDIGHTALRGDFWTNMLRGVFAGWLIALMIWLLPSAETARVAIIIIITYVVGLSGFPHIIAGSIEAFYAALTGQAAWSDVIFVYSIPTLIGNIIGGVSLVAAFSYAQVAPGRRR